MYQEAAWECLREVSQATDILNQQERARLNYEQKNALSIIESGLGRLKEALQQAEAQRNDPNFAAADWNQPLLSPLTTVRGFSQLLLDGACGQLSRQQMRLIHIIHHNTTPLHNLISKRYLEFNVAQGSVAAN